MVDDALYRLTKATGREHVSNGATTEPEAEGFNPAQALPGDGAALRNYTRQWSYDQVGNILSLIHTANAGSWNRSYAYATDSNRLNTTTVGQTTDNYSHNAHGSFKAMPHLDVLDWDHNEHLSHVKRGTSETWYVYDSAGQRVRKLTEKPGQSEERIYLGGFEIYRKSQSSTVTLERETLHIMDGARRVALVETKTIDSGSSGPLPSTVVRYQFDNHLQSATLEVDETAAVISYEEYYPYGDTSYQSGRNQAEVQRKRYRYTGKEKDEETGLYYHGARYYAPWLGRWTAADPAGMVDGASLYAYVRNHPTGLVDPDGKAGAASQEQEKNKISRGEEIFNRVAALTPDAKASASKAAKQRWGVTPMDWLIPSNDDEVTKSYSEFYELIDKAAKQNDFSPEFLHSVIMGEGMNIRVNELIQSKIKATDKDEIWTDSYQYTGLDNIGKTAQVLADKGYLDRNFLTDIVPTKPRSNEQGQTVFPADIKGLDTVIFAMAATLHEIKDRVVSDLSALNKFETIKDNDKVDLLVYARFNSEDVGKDAVQRPEVYTRKNTRPERHDQKNVRFNSLVRVATEEKIRALGIYR